MDRGRSVGQSQAGRTGQARVGRARVLVVDDDPATLELLATRLRKDGFDALTASSGLMALRQAYDNHPDAVILDIMMPGMDGFEVCRRMREMTDAVILFVSAKSRTEDILQGLQLGADDYLVKPFHYDELAMRLVTCLRRRAANSMPPALRLPGGKMLVASPSRRQVFLGHHVVQLTPKEFEVLTYLVRHWGRVVSSDAILANVWGPEYIGDHRLVKQFIYRLRGKLEEDPAHPRHILTMRGSGYVFEESSIEGGSRSRP